MSKQSEYSDPGSIPDFVDARFFDSLVHTTADGSWLGGTKYNASLGRLLNEIELVKPYRACLVSIAGYQDNDVLLQHAGEYPDIFVPIAGFNPSSFQTESEIVDEVTSIANRGFAGIKLHPRLNFYDPLENRCLAAIDAAGDKDLVVFLDTLFRQNKLSTRHPADIVDIIANRNSGTPIVLLHGGGSHVLDMFEMVRMHSNLILDLSFTLLRYQGSSLDLDMGFLCNTLDQRLIVGSDFPEYTPLEAKKRIFELTNGLPEVKRENILFHNLEKLFRNWKGLTV